MSKIMNLKLFSYIHNYSRNSILTYICKPIFNIFFSMIKNKQNSSNVISLQQVQSQKSCLSFSLLKDTAPSCTCSVTMLPSGPINNASTIVQSAETASLSIFPLITFSYQLKSDRGYLVRLFHVHPPIFCCLIIRYFLANGFFWQAMRPNKWWLD